MRPKDLWVRGRWTIRLELNRLGLHVVGLVMALVFLFRIMWGALFIIDGSGVKRTGSNRLKLQALSWL